MQILKTVVKGDVTFALAVDESIMVDETCDYCAFFALCDFRNIKEFEKRDLSCHVEGQSTFWTVVEVEGLKFL